MRPVYFKYCIYVTAGLHRNNWVSRSSAYPGVYLHRLNANELLLWCQNNILRAEAPILILRGYTDRNASRMKLVRSTLNAWSGTRSAILSKLTW